MKELILIAVAHTVFIIACIWFKKSRSLSDVLLVGWLCFLALPLLSQLISPGMLDISIPILSQNLLYSLGFGPFLWLFLSSLTGKLQIMSLRDGVHFVPFLVITLYQITSQQPTFPELPRAGDGLPLTAKMIEAANMLSLFGYSFASLWRLNKHRADVLNSFSTLSTQITLSWLFGLTCGFIATYLLPIVAFYTPWVPASQVHGVAIIGFIYILSFFGIKQSQVFIQPKLQTEPEADRVASPALKEVMLPVPGPAPEKGAGNTSEGSCKYQNSGLSKAKACEYLKRLEEYTAGEMPYLNANLTVDKLASQLKIPRHYLTQILNEEMDKSFYLYINEYRIEHVKQLLSDPANKNLTILDIAYESGFNSKSTFNTVFKKFTNMTPSQFRRSGFDS